MKKGALVSFILAGFFCAILIFISLNYNINLGRLSGKVISDIDENGLFNCTDNQTILKLYSQNNSHAEVYNGTGNYPLRVCYNEIFGSDYSGINPHNCSGNNSVLRLSSLTNAHAETSNLNNYSNEVCYGNLSCVAKTTPCNVSLNETFIVSLSSWSNAHLSINEGGYQINICCSNGVNLTVYPIDNTVPVANITSPKSGEVYFVNDEITFNQSSTPSNNSEITDYLWDFGDGTTSNESSGTHIYGSFGVKQITLTIRDSKNKVDSDSVEILIARIGENVFPIIDFPKDTGEVDNKTVHYIGNSSYVINITNSSGLNFICLGGGCPDNVSGSNSCGPCQINDPNNKRGFYDNMNFAWSFGNDPNANPVSGMGKYNGTVYYEYAGPNIIKLILTLGISEQITNRFIINTGFGECINNGYQYWNINKLFNMTGPNAMNCFGIPGIGGYGSCCPVQFVCKGTATSASCQPSCNNVYTKNGNTSQITYCDDYNYVSNNVNVRESQCLADCVGVRAKEKSDKNITDSSARCVWTNESKCAFIVPDVDYDDGYRNVRNTSTIWEVNSYGECLDGYQLMGYCLRNATSVNYIPVNVTSGCISSKSLQVECSNAKIELPFFGSISAIVALSIIMTLYLFKYHKKIR